MVARVVATEDVAVRRELQRVLGVLPVKVPAPPAPIYECVCAYVKWGMDGCFFSFFLGKGASNAMDHQFLRQNQHVKCRWQCLPAVHAKCAEPIRGTGATAKSRPALSFLGVFWWFSFFGAVAGALGAHPSKFSQSPPDGDRR